MTESGRVEALRRALRLFGLIVLPVGVFWAGIGASVGVSSLAAVGGLAAVFALWLLGVFGPFFGTLADRIGWRRLALAAFGVAAAGLALTLPARLPTLVLGLALVTLSNWAGVTAAQIGVAEASDVDRGTASALYYSIYYFTGALGGYLPGLAWEHFHWGGVVVTGWFALALAVTALALGGRR